ncbi:MAG TPA: tetratricopeptide repeat protein [Stellaceae bacterium]|jgi:tetratricopeptide (TPR) repeat protein|nr:tetratricopeptide repeat protein [Stellaceae bacterium]
MSWIWPRLLAPCLLLLLAAVPGRAEDSPEWTQCTQRPDTGTDDNAVIAACTKVIEAAQEPPDRLAAAVFSRGLVYTLTDQRDKADADFDAALRLNPKLARIYIIRGYQAIGDDHLDDAVKQFDQAIAIDPKLAAAYEGRGLAFTSDSQFDKAIPEYQKAIELDPKDASTYSGLALAYQEKGQDDRAIEYYTKAIDLAPKSAKEHYNRGNAYAALKQWDRAIADYSAAIDLQPNYARALEMRGLAYDAAGKGGEASADWDAAVVADPNFKLITAASAELRARGAAAVPPANGEDETEVFEFYVARYGNIACGFGMDDAKTAALERAVADRVRQSGMAPGRAKQLDARAEAYVAGEKRSAAKFCASDGEFAGRARGHFDDAAKRP